MTKGELIKKLQESDAPDDTLVLLSSDEEGNYYRDASIDTTVTKAYPEGYGWEVIHPDDVKEYLDDGYTDLTDVIIVW